jgi:hypothetical protein
MTYHGYIKNGVAVLDAPVQLPDGTVVRVEVEMAPSDFWQGQNADGLAREQNVQAANNPSDLRMDWPQEDSIDELIALIREVRR